MLDATDQAALVRNGEVAATELVAGAIERIERAQPGPGRRGDDAVDQAPATVAACPPRGHSGACPTCSRTSSWRSRARRSTRAREFLRGNVSTYTSELVHRLRRAGLVILGRTNTPEFGMVPDLRAAGCRAHPQPVGPAALDQRIERRIGSCRRVADGADGPRQRPRRLHALPRGGVRAVRAEADPGAQPARPGVRRRRRRMGGGARPDAVSVRDSAALLDATAGPAPGDPYPAPPARAAVRRRRSGPTPVGCASPTPPALPSGERGHPDCVPALDDAVALCAELGHDLVEADLPGLDDRVGAAIGTVFDAATAWIVGYWVRRGAASPSRTSSTRSPAPTGTRGAASAPPTTCWPSGPAEVRPRGRGLPRRREHGGVDLWLTPTMSAPPARIGEIASTAAEPLRALANGGADGGLRR